MSYMVFNILKKHFNSEKLNLKLNIEVISSILKLIKRREKIVEKNINIIKPDDLESVKENFYEHISMNLIEFFRLGEKFKVKEKLNLKLEKQQIFVTAHFANWEYLANVVANSVDNIYILARKLDYLEEWMANIRSVYGGKIIYKHETKKILKTLREGKNLGYLFDLHDKHGKEIYFFGRKVKASDAFLRFSLKYKVPIKLIFAVRESFEKFKIIDYPYFIVEKKEEILPKLQYCYNILENLIKAYPHQWYLFHNRFKEL